MRPRNTPTVPSKIIGLEVQCGRFLSNFDGVIKNCSRPCHKRKVVGFAGDPGIGDLNGRDGQPRTGQNG